MKGSELVVGCKSRIRSDDTLRPPASTRFFPFDAVSEFLVWSSEFDISSPVSVSTQSFPGPDFDIIQPSPGAFHPSNPAIRPKFILFETICIKLGQAAMAQAIGE
jgi:hypothetical protein